MGLLARERWINSLWVDMNSRQEVCTWFGLRAPLMLHYVYLYDRLLLSPPPPYTYTHTHKHRDTRSGPGPVPDCIWLVIVSSQLGSSGAPAALMEQSKAGLSSYTPSHPPTPPLFTPSQDKFNLEVPRTDKTRRQHKGQRGREVIWYLLLPPFTSTHIHTHSSSTLDPLSSPFLSLHPQTKTSFFFPPLLFFLLSDRWQEEERRMSSTRLLISDMLPVELNDDMMSLYTPAI